MQPENAIEVRDLTKKFKVYMDKGSQLKERVLFRKRNRYEERWVLNGISFNVRKGEAVGLIGHNGCGKSTTLKLLTKIIYPDSGTVEMNGRVSSLIELGAGFHPDMSGRENIYTNASIFGLSKKEIDARVDEIIAFSELEDYIDNPVRTYSSGMYMRLMRFWRWETHIFRKSALKKCRKLKRTERRLSLYRTAWDRLRKSATVVSGLMPEGYAWTDSRRKCMRNIWNIWE